MRQFCVPWPVTCCDFDLRGRFHGVFVKELNAEDSCFKGRASYDLSELVSSSGISCHVKLHPPIADADAWAQYTATDPQFVGGRGGVLFVVTQGTLLLNVYRNSVMKMDYLVANQNKLQAVLEFAQTYLDRNAPSFRDRQVQHTNSSNVRTMF